GSNLRAIEVTQFRKLGENRSAGFGADTGNGLQKFILTTPVVVTTYEAFDLAINRVDLFVETSENLIDALGGQLGITSATTVEFHRTHGDQLTTTSDEVFKFREFFRCFFQGPRFYVLCEARQHACVDSIRLGVLSMRLTEMVREAGIDNGYDKTCSDEFCGEPSFEATGGLHDDQRPRERLQALDESLNTSGIVRQRAAGIRRQEKHLEVFLSDINSNERL